VVFPELSIAFESSLPDTFCIYTNHNYLQLTLRELLYNASKYSDGQNIMLRIIEKEQTVRFIVQDTGPGIPEEDSIRLFEPFTKANDLSDGLGLGLPLAKRHIDSLNGELIHDTSYHEGCRFIIVLPFRQ
jgi:signal transduction histidine kinase